MEESSENIPHFSLASQSELCVLKKGGGKRERRKEENILLDDITIFLIESEQPGGILGILWNEEYEIQVGINVKREGERGEGEKRSGREFLIYFVVGGEWHCGHGAFQPCRGKALPQRKQATGF